MATKHNVHYLNRNDAQICYTISGMEYGPTLLLLHGGFGSWDDFAPNLNYLESQFRVISIDSRGQGRSTLGHEGLSYQLMQQDVEAVLNKLGIDELSIMGFSDGGILAYRLAAFTELQLKNLITIGSRWHVRQTGPFKEFLETLTGDIWRDMFPEKYAHYTELNPAPDYDTLTSEYTAMCLDPSEAGHPNEAVSQISCPILAIRGEADPVVSDSDLEALTEIVENVHVCTLSDAEHSAHTEQQEEFQSKVKQFMNLT
jgi:pimeloyl-ACP methyl ester carboxylesterase